jgi:hypothetical protein
MNETARRTAVRCDKRDLLTGARKRERKFIETPQGHTVACDLIPEFANFLAGKLEVQPDPPPKFMREPVQELLRQADGPEFLALAGLLPLLDTVFKGWDPDDRRGVRKRSAAEMKLKRRAGDVLHRRLRKDKIVPSEAWGEEEFVKAGGWLLPQAMGSPFFDHDDDGIPCLSALAQSHVKQIRERMIAADPSYAPRLLPPEPWTEFEKSSDGFMATFVRCWPSEVETQKAE